ncbi:LPS assembly protein LptD [Rheinheimera sp.]|uniref:LPS-assembly protein LptD n=1 Tax=Rheinheimera sp. TaxID=1869214 RepID=UPI00307D1474
MTPTLIHRLMLLAFGLPCLALAEEQVATTRLCYIPEATPAGFDLLRSDDTRLRVLSDRIQMLQNQTAVLEGHIEISHRNTLMTASEARIDQQKQTLSATGGIEYYSPGLKVSSSDFQASLKQNSVDLGQANYRLTEQSGRGFAERLQARDKHIELSHASFTTCPEQDQSWALHAQSILINNEAGWGEAWHSVMKIGDVPVFYLPYMTFPVSEKRKSGLLFPKIGSSQKLGLDLEAPYYLNLADNYDATLTPRYMSKRGAQLKSEFRYLTSEHQGMVQLEMMPEDNEKPAGFGGRYLSHLSHSGDLSERWRASIDFTDVSDDAYLTELGSDYSNQSDTQLYRQASLNYFGDTIDSQLRLQGFETLGNYASSYAALPQLDVQSAAPMPLGAGLQFLWSGQYVHFKNDDAIIHSADRLHLEPTLRWPLLTPAMELVAETSLLHTQYQQDSNQDLVAVDEDPSRTLPKVRLNAKFNLERELEWDNKAALQTLEPQIQYLYMPYRDQSAIGRYDSTRLQDDYYGLFRENRYSGLDRIADTNQLTLGVTTRFYDQQDTELFRFSLGQIVYLEDAQSIDPVAGEMVQADSVLASELLWHWRKGWYLNTAVQYDASTERLVKSSASIDYIADDNTVLQLNHRYSRAVSDYEVEQAGLLGTTPINDQWKLVASYYRDLNQAQMMEASFGLQYEDCCWAVRLVARRQINTNLEQAVNDPQLAPSFDNGIAIQFVLKGFGQSAGFSVADMLSDGIFGYRRPYLLNN